MSWWTLRKDKRKGFFLLITLNRRRETGCSNFAIVKVDNPLLTSAKISSATVSSSDRENKVNLNAIISYLSLTRSSATKTFWKPINKSTNSTTLQWVKCQNVWSKLSRPELKEQSIKICKITVLFATLKKTRKTKTLTNAHARANSMVFASTSWKEEKVYAPYARWP